MASFSPVSYLLGRAGSAPHAQWSASLTTSSPKMANLANYQSLPVGHFRGLCYEGSLVEAVDFGSYTKAKLTWNDGKKLEERKFRQLHG